MQTSDVTLSKTQKISMVSSWCNFLRHDMDVLFKKDMQAFLESLPKILIEQSENLPSTQQQGYLDIISLLNDNKSVVLSDVNKALKKNIDIFIDFIANQYGSIPTHSKDGHSSGLALIDTGEIETRIIIENYAGKLARSVHEAINDTYLRISHLIPKIQTSNQLPCHPKLIIQSMLDSFLALKLQTEHNVILVKIFADFISTKELDIIIKNSTRKARIPEFNREIIRQSSDSSSTAKKQSNHNIDDNQQNNNSHTQQQSHTNQQSKDNLGINSTGVENQNHSAQNITDTESSHLKSDLMEGSSVRYSSYVSKNDASNTTNADSNHNQQQSNSSNAELVLDHRSIIANNLVKSQKLLNELGELRNLRESMSRAMPIAPKAQNPLVSEEVLGQSKVDVILEQLQRQQSVDSVTKDSRIQTVAEVRDLIKEQLISNDEHRQTIADEESDIINLISMLFGEMLDNPNLSNVMKALLARLQIPILRVALMTPNFIALENHPSRLLIQKLIDAGIGWDENNKNDKFFQAIETIVFRVLQEFQEDQKIFDKLLIELSDIIDVDSQKTNKSEERTLVKEQKKVESQLAKSEVQKEINKRLIGKQVPFCVVKLIQNGWWQVLYHTNIRHGIDNKEWKNALKIVDALIWSVSPPKDSLSQEATDWIKQLAKIQKRLMKGVSDGLEMVKYNLFQKTELINQVSKIHQQLLARQKIHALPISKNQDNVSLDEQFKVLELTDSTKDSVVLPQDALTNIQEMQSAENTESLAETINKVRNLNTGQWIEFNCNTESPERRKLVAKIRALNKMVFTNRRGIKIAELTVTSLAKMIQENKAKIINKDKVVDKTLYDVFNKVEEVEALL